MNKKNDDNNSEVGFVSKAEVIPVVAKSDESFLLYEENVPDELPLLPVRGNTVFPGVVIPIVIGRSSSIKLMREAEKKEMLIACVSQVNEVEEPTFDDMCEVGVLGRVLRLVEMPNDDLLAVIQGTMKCRLKSITDPNPYYKCTVQPIDENIPISNPAAFHHLVGEAVNIFSEIQQAKYESKDLNIKKSLKNIQSDTILVNFMCSRIGINNYRKQNLLEIFGVEQRLSELIDEMNREQSFLESCNNIKNRARQEMDRQQHEYFLHQQMRMIQEELGANGPQMGADELESLFSKAAEADWPNYVDDAFGRSVQKLRRTPPQTPDFTVEYNYAELLTELPWNKMSHDSINIDRAQKVLDKDHYGMEKVKQRIIEHLAVLKMKGDLKSPILCFVGPPGTGKTSLGKSIATAMKRKYVRVALGGLHDEVEIRGHRKTYVGAMPGRIIKGIKKAGVSNPVFVLDEIDKVQGMSNHGDPTSALLEVLDPEQNNAFHDNFLDLDYDLSNVLFIATANSLSTIQPALLDRMEIIDLGGYILEEKIEIAQRHLLPRQLKEHGLDKKAIKLNKSVMTTIINDYTRESGVRQLEKAIAKVVRHRAVQIARGDEYDVSISPASLKEILGLPIHNSDKCGTRPTVGVVTGLAWTQVGGEILFIESCTSKGKGTLTLTGNLGDVMKESATLAFEYIKSNADQLGINPDVFENTNIHIHVPEGATPKDGPSAGITMFTAMVSAFTHQAVLPNVAMTGEITLRGLVTPVGGIREKILAAKRAGITDIILSEHNRRDIEDIPQQYLSGLQFHYVHEMKEALPIAFGC